MFKTESDLHFFNAFIVWVSQYFFEENSTGRAIGTFWSIPIYNIMNFWRNSNVRCILEFTLNNMRTKCMSNDDGVGTINIIHMCNVYFIQRVCSSLCVFAVFTVCFGPLFPRNRIQYQIAKCLSVAIVVCFETAKEGRCVPYWYPFRQHCFAVWKWIGYVIYFANTFRSLFDAVLFRKAMSEFSPMRAQF